MERKPFEGGYRFGDGVRTIWRGSRSLVEEITKKKRAIRDLAERGDVNALQAVLDAGGDVQSRSDYGTTALHKASSSGQLEAVKLLLAYGADTAALAPRNDGNTPLMEAVKYGHAECAEAIRSWQKRDSLYASAKGANLDTVESAKRLASFSKDAAFFLDELDEDLDSDESDGEDPDSGESDGDDAAPRAYPAGKLLFMHAMTGEDQQLEEAGETVDDEEDGFVLLDAQSDSTPSTGYTVFTDIFVFVNPSSGGELHYRFKCIQITFPVGPPQVIAVPSSLPRSCRSSGPW
jgi:hypothetical protein